MTHFLVAILLLLTGAVTLASEGPQIEPGPVQALSEGHRVARALIANPEIGEALRAHRLLEVDTITAQALRPGVTRFVLKVSTCGMCMLRTGSVSIIEDVTPTYYDGAVEYKVDIQIEK